MTKSTLKKKNNVVVEDNSIILKNSFDDEQWIRDIKFDIYDQLSESYKEKLRILLEEIDLSSFEGIFRFDDRQSVAVVDNDEALKNFEYVLDHTSNNTAMKFIILVLANTVRFFNSYIIDQYLLHERVEDYEKPIKNLIEPFDKFSINDVACTDPEEFIKNNQLSNWFNSFDSSQDLNDVPIDSFLTKAAEHCKNLKKPRYLQTFLDYMYFYNEHNKDGYDWSFQNRAEALKIAFKGYENVSVAELTAFLALTDFDNNLYECVDQSSQHSLKMEGLPILLDFVEEYKVDSSTFDESMFLELFKNNFEKLRTSDNNFSRYNNPYGNVVQERHLYAFLFMLMEGDEEKFAQFCEFVVKEGKYEKDLVSFYVSENLQSIIEWVKPESSISSIPFSLLANVI